MDSAIEKKWFKEGINVGSQLAREHVHEFIHSIESSHEQYRNLMKEFLVVYKENDFWKDDLSFRLRNDVGNNIDYDASTSELIDEMTWLEGKFDAGFYTGVVKYLQKEKLI